MGGVELVWAFAGMTNMDPTKPSKTNRIPCDLTDLPFRTLALPAGLSSQRFRPLWRTCMLTRGVLGASVLRGRLANYGKIGKA